MSDQLPAKPNDPLDNELSLRAQIDASGLNVGAKSRALSALDRMLGTLIDNVGVGLEGRPKRIRATHDAEVAVIAAQGRAEQLALSYSEETLKRAAAQLLTEEVRKLENREAVAAEAVLLLTDQSAGPASAEAAKPDTATDPPSDDWMNLFVAYAEKASSKSLRSLWAKVLAGEIRKPGAFSPATMRFVAEFDQQTARMFETMGNSVIDGDFVPKDNTNPHADITDSLRLEEVGLITGATGMISKNLMIPPSGPVAFSNLAEDRTGGIVLVQGTPGQRFEVPAMILTRVGREVLKLLPKRDHFQAALNLARVVKTAGLTSVAVQKIAKAKDGTVSTELIQVFPPPPIPSGLPTAHPLP